MIVVRVLGALLVTAVLCSVGTILGVALWSRGIDRWLFIVRSWMPYRINMVLFYSSLIASIGGPGMLAGTLGYWLFLDGDAPHGLQWWAVGAGVIGLLVPLALLSRMRLSLPIG